ncbi:TPA: immunity 49 family protein [Vibrio parahaemolyticus]|uniref:immunity 49 family protein n=1 Tax=Vibrio parahaemolyticus TaxID=670 RepID=UPI002269A074|nr:immunity 49 family protein [Vibrio parahaemolyticus]ELI5416743.1 immunity 49 family protein [Vibrio parahaemolyticus]ELI5425416.1 immunity 49 family protein [Vibrio parahaemolyticus]MCX8904189.1 immunity 49 family protein [Vibrio parahaemolyticus]HCE2449173.1 immunity 49 family protein [Vibrio parahaemolyticus]HCG8452511.1 immunity 49 family protein [Vibrio parahaemolyticus]
MQSKESVKIVERKANPELDTQAIVNRKKFINRVLDNRKEGLKIRRENLVSLGDFAIDQVRWYTWFQASHEDEQICTLRLYETSLMGACYHRLAIFPNETLTVQILGYPEVTWDGEGILEMGFICPSMWLDAYFISTIVRDRPSMDVLANFPISLMKQSATKAGELSYMLVDVIQSFHNRTSDYPDKLVAAMDAAIAQGDDWALEIAMGILETFAALTTDIGYDFEEVLIKNLQFQEQYQMRLDAPKKLISIETFISFPLLGMACMWYDKGHRLSIETGWLPPYLVEGRWLEEVKAGNITR